MADKNYKFQLYFPADDNTKSSDGLSDDLSKYNRSSSRVLNKNTTASTPSVDRIVDPNGNITPVNNPAPHSQNPSNKGFNPNNYFPPTPNIYPVTGNSPTTLGDIARKFFDTILGGYNPNNPFDPQTLVEGSAIGIFIGDKFGKNIGEKIGSFGLGIGGAVLAKKAYHDYRKKH